MNHDPRHDGGDALPETLRWQLRAMRRDQHPGSDLWPAISERLRVDAQSVPGSPRHGRAPWLAMAASVLLVVGLVGTWSRPFATDPVHAATLREADRLARQYDEALASIPNAPRSHAIDTAMTELDRSARDIRRALSMDPDSRLLLDQLQRTYARRLALSQRAIHG